MLELLQPLLTAGGGAAIVLLVRALAHAIQRRSDGTAAQAEAHALQLRATAERDSAAAKAVVELVAQLGDLREVVDRERDERRAEVSALQVEVSDLREALATATSAQEHHEAQAEIYRALLAQRDEHLAQRDARIERLVSELQRLYREVTGGFQSLTIRPPKLD